MCGIAGQMRVDQHGASSFPIKAVDLEKMCMAIHHRGPDHQGMRVWQHAAIGYRRLSIIDLSNNAFQPMINESESVCMVFNGEIYNFQELRKELSAKGYNFRSQSDSEVVLRGFEAWGEEVVKKIDGMYAFAIYKPEEHYLFLARDPFGIKPLYYALEDNHLFFASEIRSLLVLDRLEARLDAKALLPYLTLGYVPTPNTMFHGILKLPAGHTMTVKQGKVTMERFFDLRDSAASASSVATVESALKESVRMTLVSDVPLGVFLSGGLDSSLLTLHAKESSNSTIQTFSIGFDNHLYYDETKKSAYVADTLKTDHHLLPLQEESAAILGKVVNALEEPLADTSIIPTYHLARMTKAFVTVALSGEGGDELFGGYNRYVWEPRADLSGGLFGKMLAPLLLPFLERVATPQKHGFANFIRRVRKFLKTGQLDKASRYLSWFAILPKEQIAELLDAKLLTSEADPLERFKQLLQEGKNLSNLQRLQYVDLNTMLVDNLLLKADKIGMSQSLEMRVPFLNRAVAEAIYRLPDRLKVKGGVTKVAQRRMLTKHFSSEFTAQSKKGFEVPIGEWLRGDGSVLIKEHLNPEALAHGVFSATVVQELVDTHMQKRRDLGQTLFALIVFNSWFREFNVKLP